MESNEYMLQLRDGPSEDMTEEGSERRARLQGCIASESRYDENSFQANNTINPKISYK